MPPDEPEHAPPDPIPEDVQGWMQFHILFKRAMAGGFTMSEAAAIVVATIAHHQAQPD